MPGSWYSGISLYQCLVLAGMSCSIIYQYVKDLLKKCLFPVSLARERVTGLALPGNPEPKLLWQARSKCNIQPGPPSRKCDGVLQNLGRASPKPGTNVNFASKKPQLSLCFSRDSRLNRGSIQGASRLQRGKTGDYLRLAINFRLSFQRVSALLPGSCMCEIPGKDQ